MKSVIRAFILCIIGLGGGSSSLLAASNEYYHIQAFAPGELNQVVLAFDPEDKEFIWKDYGAENPAWTTVNNEDLDPVLRDVKSKEEVEKIVTYDGIKVRLRHIGDDVGVAIDYSLKGGGPVTAAVCGIVCKIIGLAGCGAGAVIVGAANPGIGVLYAAVCSALDAGGVAGCMAACLALPTP